MRILLLLWLFGTGTGILSATELIRNGSFTAGLTSWDLYGSSASRLFSAVTLDGISALRYEKTSATPADNYHIDQILTTLPDTMYRVSVRYRSATLSPVFAVATMGFQQFKTAVLPSSSTWRDFVFTFYSGKETQVRLQLFAGAQGQARQAFDGESVFTAITCESGPPTLIIDPAAGTRQVPAAFTGVNTLFWLETPEDLADGIVPQLLFEARFGILRYPAGTAAQNYDWRRNAVFDSSRYPGAPRSGESYLDADGFITLARRVNASPYIVLNLASIFMTTATPAEADYAALTASAASMAAHFKQAGMRVACFELGNEHYLNDQGNSYVMMTATQYAAIAQRMIAAIRAVDPDAVFGAVGPSSFSAIGGRDAAAGGTDPWWPTVLSAIGRDLGKIIVHHYWGGSEYYSSTIDYGAEIETFRQELSAWQQQNGGRRPLAIGYTEWGGKNYPDSTAYALFVHEALSSFAAHEADFAIVWPHRRWTDSAEWAQSQILDDRTPRAAHSVFAAWGSELNGGTFLPFSSDSMLPPFLFGAAARNHDAVTVLLGNKSTTDQTLSLSVRGPYTKASVRVIGSTAPVTTDFRNESMLTVPARALVAVQFTTPTAAPSISRAPESQTVTAGQPATFSAVAVSTLPLAYQWKRDGANVPGASGSTFTIANVQPADAGRYTVVVTTDAGSVTSSEATLSVGRFDGSRLLNLSILTNITAAAPAFTIGTVIGGAGTVGTKPLLVRAVGPSLASFGVGGILADPILELRSGSVVAGANDNWDGTSALASAFGAVGAFPFVSGSSKDAAVYQAALPAGAHTVNVSGVGSATGAVLAELYDAASADLFTYRTPRLINVSVLRQIEAGETLAAGFVIGGSWPKQILIRGVGPTLGAAPFGLDRVLADPRLELFSAQTAIASNDNWGTPMGTGAATAAQLNTAFTQVGAFALAAGSRDAALLVTLSPGSYTARLTGVANAAGLALLEIYETK